jgi:hypothetical protein
MVTIQGLDDSSHSTVEGVARTYFKLWMFACKLDRTILDLGFFEDFGCRLSKENVFYTLSVHRHTYPVSTYHSDRILVTDLLT